MLYNTIIIGAGAAGLFASSNIGKSGKSVLVLDNGKKVARKILISGGGYCNFTNLNLSHNNYLSMNPKFAYSALSRFTPDDFLQLIKKYNIKYYEKELGQLFTKQGSASIVQMLLQEIKQTKVDIKLYQLVKSIEYKNKFFVKTENELFESENLIIATGGLALKELGSTPFGYQIAEQFGLEIIPISPGLVPLTWQQQDIAYTKLSGLSIYSEVKTNNPIYPKISFTNNILFTHKGLSGPAILQISNYWQPNQIIKINLLPNQNIFSLLKQAKDNNSKVLIHNFLNQYLPKNFIDLWLELNKIPHQPINQISDKKLQQIAEYIHDWQIIPNNTEGYRKAEVTKGGVDTKQLSSKSMAYLKNPNLYFIGEVLDITGWLGGYNLQWAWSSAFACANDIINK